MQSGVTVRVVTLLVTGGQAGTAVMVRHNCFAKCDCLLLCIMMYFGFWMHQIAKYLTHKTVATWQLGYFQNRSMDWTGQRSQQTRQTSSLYDQRITTLVQLLPRLFFELENWKRRRRKQALFFKIRVKSPKVIGQCPGELGPGPMSSGAAVIHLIIAILMIVATVGYREKGLRRMLHSSHCELGAVNGQFSWNLKFELAVTIIWLCWW